MWYNILYTAVLIIFIQNTKIYICYPELGTPKKFQSCPEAVLKYFIFLNFWANNIFSSWQAVWPTSFSSISKNTHPRQMSTVMQWLSLKTLCLKVASFRMTYEKCQHPLQATYHIWKIFPHVCLNSFVLSWKFYAAVFHHYLYLKKLLTNLRSMDSSQPALDTKIVYFFKWQLYLQLERLLHNSLSLHVIFWY